MGSTLPMSGIVNMADIADRWPADDAQPSTDEGPSDRSLVRQFRLGDQEAFQLLHQRYVGRLLALARSRRSRDLAGRVDDDEIVQSVFGSLIRGVYRGLYDVPAGQELWGLLMVITVNKIRAKGAHHRAGKRDVRRTTGDEGLDRAPALPGAEEEDHLVLKLSVEEALERLTEWERVVIRLRMEGHEVMEISQKIGRSKRTVERLLQEGRSRLAEMLEVAIG